LWKIYETQSIDDNLKSHYKKVLVYVYEHLIQEANNTLISEYAKRESSWKKLKETVYDLRLNEILEDYLISDEEKQIRENEKEVDSSNIENTIFLISEIQKMGLKFWDGFKTYIDKNKPDEFDYYLAFDLFKKLKEHKNLSPLEIAFGKKVLDYIKLNPILKEEIKSFSELNDEEVVEVKFIYDKLLLLKKDEWQRILDLASQTKIFSNLELANIKSVQVSLVKKEKVKEQALLRTHESLKKLKKFGINI
jgi:hypothetical protein